MHSLGSQQSFGFGESHKYDIMLDNIEAEDFKKEIEFLGTDPFKVKTTNAQEMFNSFQMFPQVLVLDLRSQKHFNN